MTPISQFKRYMWLVDLLHSHGALSKAEIDYYWSRSNLNENEEDGIPKRTFMRMKNDIGELFGIDICCLRSQGNRYTLENPDDMQDGGVKQWLINCFSINNVLLESQQIKERIVLEDIPSGNRFLTQVISAMQQNKVLRMQYHSFEMKAPREFEIMPYCLRCFKQRWYIIAQREGNKEPHFYSLDRVVTMEVTEQTFQLPKDFSAKDFLYNYYGVMHDKKAELVQIRVTSSYAPYLRSLPLHHSQREIEKTDDYAVFQYYIAPTNDFISELRSILPQITVLTPHWLREQFREEAKQVLERF